MPGGRAVPHRRTSTSPRAGRSCGTSGPDFPQTDDPLERWRARAPCPRPLGRPPRGRRRYLFLSSNPGLGSLSEARSNQPGDPRPALQTAARRDAGGSHLAGPAVRGAEVGVDGRAARRQLRGRAFDVWLDGGTRPLRERGGQARAAKCPTGQESRQSPPTSSASRSSRDATTPSRRSSAASPDAEFGVPAAARGVRAALPPPDARPLAATVIVVLGRKARMVFEGLYKVPGRGRRVAAPARWSHPPPGSRSRRPSRSGTRRRGTRRTPCSRARRATSASSRSPGSRRCGRGGPGTGRGRGSRP